MSMRRVTDPTLDGAAASVSGGHIVISSGGNTPAPPFYVLTEPGSVLHQVTSLPWYRQGQHSSIQLLSEPPAGGGDTTEPTLALTDMGTLWTYHGLEGGLYAGGTNTPPAGHVTAGLAAAGLIEPLDANGDPDANGWIVMLSIGMSNVRYETCKTTTTNPANCQAGSWMKRYSQYASANPRVRIVNGGQDGRTIPGWDSSTDVAYDTVRDTRLPAGLTEAQVQAIWMKGIYVNPTVGLPSLSANAYAERDGIKLIIQAAKARYPNLQQVFLSPRIYAGYGNSQSPEPYAYENAWAVKWVIDDYITGTFIPGCWVGWGVYPWANGTTARGDGLTWLETDYESDKVHPSNDGISKMGNLIHEDFVASQFAPYYKI